MRRDADIQALRTGRVRLLQLLEDAGSWVAEAGYREVAHDAREEFLEATGRVNEEDRSFEPRMNAFLEFLLVEWRPPRELGCRILLELYVRARGGELSPGDRRLLGCAAASHRSLFVLLRRGKDGVDLSDILYGGQWHLPDPECLLGVEPGDVVEARIVALEQGLVLLPSVYHHPSRAAVYARRFVESELAAGREPRQIAAALARKLLMRDRYPGMNLRQVYG